MNSPPERILRSEVDAAGGELELPRHELVARFRGHLGSSPTGDLLLQKLLSVGLKIGPVLSRGSPRPGWVRLHVTATPTVLADLPESWEPPSHLRRGDGRFDLESVVAWATESLDDPERARGMRWAVRESRGFVFRIGDLFPADDEIAQWLVQLAMHQNDTSLLWRLRPSFAEAGGHAVVYLMRLTAAHLYEASRLCLKAYDRESVIRDWIERLPSSTLSDFHRIRASAMRGERFGAQLARIRHGVFHYPGVHPNQRAEFREVLHAAAHEESMWYTGESTPFTRAVFADRLVQLQSGLGTGDWPVAEFMDRLIEDVFALSSFVDDALGVWFIQHHSRFRLAENGDYERFD